MNMEKKLARALRTLASYTGGSDSPASHPCAKAWATLAEYEKARGPGREEKSAPALRACVSESTPDDYARTVDGAADLTARDWVARALETAREEDANNGGDAFGDIADDLRRALARMDRAKEASEDEDAQARADHAEFIAAAVRLRRFVDVSTIRPGKATGQGWEANCSRFDSAFAALSKEGR
jgi:hypothetical protein